ncbi:MAG: sigma 54-interacting transcriptional regulator [Myxococcota bacterium]
MTNRGSRVARPCSLRVITEDEVTPHALPERGEVCLGRGADAHILIPQPDVSRRHAMLRIGTTTAIRDLGSANGTRVGKDKLPANDWVKVQRGTSFTLGDVTVVLYDGPIQGRARRGVGMESLLEAVENNLSAHRRVGTEFGIISLRCVTTRKWVDVVEAMMMPRDQLAVVSDSFVVAVRPDCGPEQLRSWSDTLLGHLKRIGARPEASLVCCPTDGATVDALMPKGVSERPDRAKTIRPPQPLVRDQAMVDLYEMVDEVAPSTTTVLILGETGAGKEVLARAVHHRSPRRNKPFLAINCAALSENLLESELFGYEKGAFTGAVASKAGLLETAEGGTVFLDELGEMPRSTQAKLLRVLEERKVWRLGSLKAKDIDVRLVAATNRDLQHEIARGAFRADLFYRLNGISLIIPPLRERQGEIEPLADRFMNNAAAAMGKTVPKLSLEALHAMQQYQWPGNIRELRNVVERAVLLARSGIIGLDEMPAEIRDAHLLPPDTPTLPERRTIVGDEPPATTRGQMLPPPGPNPTSVTYGGQPAPPGLGQMGGGMRHPGGAPAGPPPTPQGYPPPGSHPGMGPGSHPGMPAAPGRHPGRPLPGAPAAYGYLGGYAPPQMTPPHGMPPPRESSEVNLQEEMERLEKARIVDALEQCNGNQTRAAKLLGITRRMLISRIERYDIPRPRAGRKKKA